MDLKNFKMIDLKFVDLLGNMHHITMPVENFKGKVGVDGSSLPGFTKTEAGDLVIRPDESTAFADPFLGEATLSCLCNLYEADTGKPYHKDPRFLARKADVYLREEGIADAIWVLPELEFYVFDSVTYQNTVNHTYYEVKSGQAHWDTQAPGYKIPHHRGYHAAPPLDTFFHLRDRITTLLRAAGIPVKYHHHEVGGAGQCEVEISPMPFLKAADAVILAKYLIKMEALKQGKLVTFMPKPLFDEAGSGLHFHIRLEKQGKPVFFKKGAYADLSPLALQFMSGILSHGRALAAYTNPSTNSYKRFVPGFEAPTNLYFSLANRNAAIRIPKYATMPEEKRFEYRPPDASCNPYLALSGILMAGADGVRRKLDPAKLHLGPYNSVADAKGKLESLPTSLLEALDALAADCDFLKAGGAFNEDSIRAWIDVKQKENIELHKRPHPFEYEMYFSV